MPATGFASQCAYHLILALGSHAYSTVVQGVRVSEHAVKVEAVMAQEQADTAVVLPPGALAYQYAEHNIQQSYVPPGAWEPSPEALQEAHARSQLMETQVRAARYPVQDTPYRAPSAIPSTPRPNCLPRTCRSALVNGRELHHTQA